MLTIIPAIDIRGGRCVRLIQGRAGTEKVYSEDPVAVAVHWVEQGAKYLHVVDLDGAFEKKPVNTELISAIVAAVNVPVEVGGGLRTRGDIDALLAAGVARAIIGTRASEDGDTFARFVREYGRQIAAGIDARNGLVQVKGWTEASGISAVELAKRLDGAGVDTIIFTDTAVDGMMTGVNIEAVARICGAVSCNVVASGGVSSGTDITALAGLGCANLAGAIVGKALYEGRVSLAELETGAQCDGSS